MILKVGLTGGLASGKSTVGEILAGLGCKVIDADEIVAELYEPGGDGHRAIVREYGRDVLSPSGEIDRVKLAERAFSTPEETKRLNALIHPLVLQHEEQLIADELERFPDRDRIIVSEATLLLEASARDRYDRIVVVDAQPDQQLERAVERGMKQGDAERRIARQFSRDQRNAQADFVIDNSGDEAELEHKVRELYDRLRAELEARKREAI